MAKNGRLIVTTPAEGRRIQQISTTTEFAKDFILRLEFRLSPGANNGVGIRTPLEGRTSSVGMEIQILDDASSKYEGKLRPAQYHGSIYGMVAPKRGFQKPVGEWNSEEITADGRHITIKLNGTAIVDASLDDIKDEEMLKTHRDLTKPEGSRGIANTKGHIGFLGHGARVEFRNIRIKELKSGAKK